MICKDHLVTGEKFEISEYENGILKTYPVPENLSEYYESENYISHNDSKNNLQDKVYQFVKSHMLSKKAKWVRRYFKQGRILDVGAGTGEFLNKMKTFLWTVEGVEPNQTARELAILKGLNLRPDLSEIRDQKFDVISLWHVLEHLPDLEKKIDELRELLNDDGVLIIAVPNFKSYDAEYYKENWAAWDVPRHLWHFSRTGLKEKLAKHNFQLIDEKPLKFDSYYVSLLSEKNNNTTLSLLNAVYRGWISNFKAASSGEYSSLTYFFKKSPNS
ncbi:class I SAM-dependent methyltransferase [Christiangramia sabulilitoris]|uniref:Class I SAM-dependent methyltransferase n=1 Tax=Christiangramia sabulilitoris TaxID=2583991 RepID=A0A550I8S6_9FLAO|nr:class I SAM-dependent methyltransferase [Christiangramia sabulilitoris]TRO67375.1 class I SAM-dependent methyltransferase [Christiangramia sabulilitoris]